MAKDVSSKSSTVTHMSVSGESEPSLSFPSTSTKPPKLYMPVS